MSRVTDVPQTVTAVLTYNANGGSGALGDQSGDASDVAISSTVPTRDGYTFMGWNSLADGSGDSYSDGDPYTLLSVVLPRCTPNGRSIRSR